MKLRQDIFQEFGFDLLLTYVSINGRAMCCPLTICFDQATRAESHKAEACYEKLIASMFLNGYPPYRLGIQSMALANRSIIDPFADC